MYRYFVSLMTGFLLTVTASSVRAQSDFIKHLIQTQVPSAVSLYVADLDNDGDPDLLGALYDSNSIAWWENVDGKASLWTRHTIGTGFGQAGCVVAGDVDGDGALDVVGSARSGNQIAWWKNLGGSPLQWSKQLVRSNYTFAHEVKLNDLDQDGDLDIIGASSSLNSVDWWRNDGGNPIHWTEFTIQTDFGMAKSIDIGDIDHDGDRDVVGAALYDNQVTWWRNEGGNPILWTRHFIDQNFNGAHRVELIDLDKDGRLDVVGAGYMGHQVAWWHNDEDNGLTWTRQILVNGFTNACQASAADFDLDGDMDIAGTSQGNGKLDIWYNGSEGSLPFRWTRVSLGNILKVWPLFITDLDQDGDPDIVAASGKDGNGEVLWFENKLDLSGISTLDNPGGFTLFPNPTSGQISIILTNHTTQSLNLRIFDLTGRILESKIINDLPPGNHQINWDLTDGKTIMPAGIYLLEYQANHHQYYERLIINLN
jgi:hypothetical protein